ncbi:MAG: hypothetical protein AB7Q37_11895 [Pyrinomonadaceae bacterium]
MAFILEGLAEIEGVALIFGSNSVLRAETEVYVQSDIGEKFERDLVAARD